MKVIVTGGTGYIGSHTAAALLQRGHQVLIIDNLSNSNARALEGIAAIGGSKPEFIEADVRDAAALAAAFVRFAADAVIHFAGLKSVAESMLHPLRYYDCNVTGTITLLRAMLAHNVRSLVFSSSATVYGSSAKVPILETAAIAPVNPYGQSKAMVETILTNLAASEADWHIACLRYFNPAGAHPGGLLGEDPRGTPNNLMPYVTQVASGRHEKLSIFGNDWPTPDGTGVRDYVHVVDLAEAHLCALDKLDDIDGLVIANIGTGRGHSVLEVVRAYEQVCGKALPVEFAPRRAGDVAESYCAPGLAEKLFGWRARCGLEDMCRDAWGREQLTTED